MRVLIRRPTAYERVEGVWGNREVLPRQVLRRGLVGETLRGFRFPAASEEGAHGGTRGFPPRHVLRGGRVGKPFGVFRSPAPSGGGARGEPGVPPMLETWFPP